jgi:hypothetical protein
MQSLDGRLIYSATDLSIFLACPNLTLLNRRTATGGPKPRPFDDLALEVLRKPRPKAASRLPTRSRFLHIPGWFAAGVHCLRASLATV